VREGGTWEQLKTRLNVLLFGPDPRHRQFWLVAGIAVVILLAVGAFIPYGIIPISYPSQMENQVSIGYEQGPRRVVPAEAVPVQGPVLVAGQPASEPVPATANSLQRGKVLYGITCIVCHGETGAGNGKLAGFFTPKPADLTGASAQGLSNNRMFLVITQGFGVMPSIAENLDVQDRWDVINYIHTLKK
jgi:mono/diheme cytochrome c family protein